MNITQSERLKRAQRSLDGLSAGDAFGENFFGPDRSVLERIETLEMPTAPWPYPDDTEMAVMLEARAEADRELLARRFRSNPAQHDVLRLITRAASTRCSPIG